MHRGSLTKDVFAELVVAAEAFSVHLVHRAQLAQRVQGGHPGEDQKEGSASPPQRLHIAVPCAVRAAAEGIQMPTGAWNQAAIIVSASLNQQCKQCDRGRGGPDKRV